MNRISRTLLLVLPTLAGAGGMVAGCLQSFDPGTVSAESENSTDDLTVPATQCAPESPECFLFCGSPECALPDAAIPPFLDVPPIYYEPDGAVNGVGTPAPAAVTTDPCVAVESYSLVIRQRSCTPCHDPSADPAVTAVPTAGFGPGFNYVLDDSQLVTALSNSYMAADGGPARLVIPGDPSDSLVYQRMVNGLSGMGGMPPSGVSASGDIGPDAAAAIVYPTAADLSVIYGWILNCVQGADGGAYTSTYYSGSFGANVTGDGGAGSSASSGDAGAVGD